MGKTYDVMAAGHVCLDIAPQFRDTGATAIGEVMQPGKLVEVGAASLSTGGSVSNTGIAIKRLGHKVCFSARVGDDAFGRITQGILEKNGSLAGVRIVKGSGSSYTVVVAPPRIDRIFLHDPGTNNEYGPEDLDPKLVSMGRLFHFGYPTLMRRMFQNEGRELQKLFQTARKAGVTTSCDLAMPDPTSEAGMAPWPKILENVLPYIDVFPPSVEEAYLLLEREAYLRMKADNPGTDLIDLLQPEDYGRLADRLLGMGARVVVLKAGHHGLYLKSASRKRIEGMGAAKPADLDNWADRELWAPSFAVSKIANANGAGDCAIAGFLAALLRGKSVEDALRTANCLGWQNVQAYDATSGVHSWEETEALLNGSMPVNSLEMESFGWAWCDDPGLWFGPQDCCSVK